MKAKVWCSTDELCLSEDACHSSEILLGDDLCVCTVWQLRGLWWIGQHLFHIQFKNQRGQRESEPRAAGAHRSAIRFVSASVFWFCVILHQMKQSDFEVYCELWNSSVGLRDSCETFSNCSRMVTFSLNSPIWRFCNCSVFRVFVLLSLFRWQPNCH